MFRVILFVLFGCTIGSVSGMTDEAKTSAPTVVSTASVLTSEADVQFRTALETVLTFADIKHVEEAFVNAEEKGADIKTVLSLADDKNNNFLHLAIINRCGLTILKFLRNKEVVVCGIEHANPMLRTVCLQNNPEQEAIIKWLITEDSCGSALDIDFVHIGGTSFWSIKQPVIEKFSIDMLRQVIERGFEPGTVIRIPRLFANKCSGKKIRSYDG